MISINQPYFLPNIGYFALLMQSRTHVILDSVKMQKQSWIRRNNFGNDHRQVTIALKNLSQNRLICEHVLHDGREQSKCLKAFLRQKYREKRYFEEIYEILSVLDNVKDDISLVSFNLMLQSKICDMLKIKFRMHLASKTHLNTKLRNSELLCSICHEYDDLNYLNLENGARIYSHEQFMQRRVVLHFNDTSNFKLKYGKYFSKSILEIIGDFGCGNVHSIIAEGALNRRALPLGGK